MADAPAAIRTLVEEHATGAIVGAFLTAGVHAFPPGEDGSWNTAAIWAVATSQQFWLVAHLRGQHWMIAVGRSSAVRLNEGWRWDSLEVDPWRIPLKRGGRSEARDLLGRWTLLEPAGQSWPKPPTLPVDRGIAAPGAWTLPDWWVSLVPAPADSHWFFCVQTRQLCPFNDWDGTIHEVPFWLGISDQSILLVARSPWNTLHIVALTQTPTLQKRRGELTFGLRTLRCRPQRLASRVAAFARATTPQLRWHTAIDQSLSAFEPSRAVALLHHARSLGHSEVCWAGIARLALACEQVETAVYGFSQLLAADPSFTLPSHWPGDHDALVRGLRREELDWIDVRTGLGFAANAHKSPLPVAGLPWPPVGFEECWWAALAATEQQDVARSAWLTRPLNGRSARALAALLGSSSPQDKAQAWQKAAEINWNEGQGSTAMECIQTAIGLVPSSRAWWMRGAWAWHLGGLRDAKEAWKEALNGDPTGSDWGDYPLAPDALCALAHLAQANSCHALADTAWEQCIRQDPARYDERLAWVAHRDQCLGQPGRAAALLDDTIVLLDQDGTEAPDSPRWALRCEQARLHIAAQENEKAIHALHDAIQSSVLELEAWDAILALAPGVVDPSTVQWWQHLQGCLAGGTENPDMQPSPVSPGPEELDALHPGGSGWLDRIRAALNPSEPPSFDTLTRGLDSLSDAGADLAQSTVDTLCERLDMPVPATLVYRGRSAFGASAWPSSPPVLLVGWTHLAPGDRAMNATELKFLLGVELAHLRCNHPLLNVDESLLGTGKSAYQVFGGFAGTAETVVDLLTLIPGLDQVRKLQTVLKLSRGVFKARSAVDKGVKLASPVLGYFGSAADTSAQPLTREGLQGAALQFRIQADRAGLLVCGHFPSAIQAIFKASSASQTLCQRLPEEGLLALLEEPEEASPLLPDERLRISALLFFATQSMPWTSHSS